MCLLCEGGGDLALGRRAHALQLLALVEHPDALPAEAALRLAREVLALAQHERTERRCDAVLPPDLVIKQPR